MNERTLKIQTNFIWKYNTSDHGKTILLLGDFICRKKTLLHSLMADFQSDVKILSDGFTCAVKWFSVGVLKFEKDKTQKLSWSTSRARTAVCRSISDHLFWKEKKSLLGLIIIPMVFYLNAFVLVFRILDMRKMSTFFCKAESDNSFRTSWSIRRLQCVR